ncbi:hypothetical protein [Streptomyces sp. NPDC031705]|uniref:D-alanyl-D-alanine carboxypeptidase n=1 Tax=Streptomyces sp. NPDC031705 TaxID=3155729 RepID=UPI003404FB87
MAGESPDKSVDEGASGEQDPRLSVFQPRDPLKEAVAAWVATAEEDAEPEPEPARGDGGTPKAAVVRQAQAPEPESAPADEAGTGEPAADAEEPDSASAEAEKAPGGSGSRSGSGSGKPSEESRTEAADGERTAVFRAVKPGSASADAEKAPGEAGSGSGKPSAEAEEPSEKPSEKPSGKSSEKPSGDVRTTAFGVVTTDPAPEADEPARAGERTAVFRTVKPGSAPAKPAAGDERTAAFRAVKPGSASDSASDAEKDSGKDRSGPAAADPRAVKPGSGSADAEKPAASSKGSGSAAADAEKGGPAAADPRAAKPAADSERTAVFRAVKPGSGSTDAEKPSASSKGSGSAAADAEKGGPADADPRAAKPAADGERTAVFRAVKPGSASADAEKPAKPSGDSETDSERTAVFRAVKPGPAPADADKARGDEPAGGKPTGGKPSADKPSGDARTTAFGVVKPDAGAKDAAKKPATPAAGKPGSESDRRVSTFVPLRGEDAPAPAAKPAVKPTPPAAPPRLDPSERTTQQPLPPRPPLDMLADLTNNPPPPPSPMRTAIRRVKIYAPIVLLLALVLAIVQLVRPLPAPKLKLTAKSTYSFEGGAPSLPWPTEGQASMAAAGLGTIGSSGEQKPVPIASVTKSMTAYIILRDHPFKKGEKGAMIDVDKTAETEGQKDKSDNESTLNTVHEGDKISEYDAIAALMIPSANNIARLLARWDSGSQEAFVKKMNDTAKELGMTNTTYTDPSGLDATTVSTAEDQVKLGLKIVEIPALVDITRMPSWTDQTGKTWPNWNRLVPFNDSLGIKTGTTTKAGGNLLFAAQKKVGDTNQLLVGAVLGQHKPPIIDSVIAASKQLLVATQKEIQGAPVVKKGQVVGYVDDGLGGHTPVVATADVQAVGWPSLTVDIKLGDGGTAIPESAKAGTEVGVLTVGDGASQVKVPVALQRELETPGFGSKLTRIG